MKLSLLILCLACLSGCTSVSVLKMDAERPPSDESVVALSVARVSFEKVRVVTPEGMTKPEADALTALVEKELLRHQIRIVTAEAKPAAAAPGQAEAPAAEAILQITEWSWTTDPIEKRFFALDKVDGEDTYRELTRAEYDAANDFKIAFVSTELTFVGRFINAATGESMATLEVRSAANWNLPQRYIATVENKGAKPHIVQENYQYSGKGWLDEAKRNTEEAVVRSVCDRISRLDEGQILPPKAADEVKSESVTKEELAPDAATPATGAPAQPAAAAAPMQPAAPAIETPREPAKAEPAPAIMSPAPPPTLPPPPSSITPDVED